MRKLAIASLLLAICACGRSDDGDASQVAALPSSGPDPVVVRVERAGGIARAYRYPALDSLVWRATQPTPAVDRILAFDGENGSLAFLTDEGIPGWIDLRIGGVRLATKERLASVASADGSAIFGVTPKGALVRHTPSGDWSLPMPQKVRRLFPLMDGTLIALADHGKGSILYRLRPPDDVVTDSVEVTRPERAATTALGDRLYLGARDVLLSIQPQSLERVERLGAEDDILAIAPTPSGDRVFLANDGGPRLEVLDRYSEDMKASVQLPGLATELRMDPLGRYLIARPVGGDSAWIVDIGTETLLGSVKTEWRSDLPTITVDGLVATVRGDDVVFVQAKGDVVSRTVEGGADDLWFFALWNGFRPRARGIDDPVSFAVEDPTAAAPSDSVSRVPVPPARRDSVTPAPPPVSPPPTEPPPPPPAPAARDAWTVSFAAVLTEARAREIAQTITVDGQHPRVVQGQTAGTTVFRVVFGPYNSKADAERIGRASKHNYWVYEGVP